MLDYNEKLTARLARIKSRAGKGRQQQHQQQLESMSFSGKLGDARSVFSSGGYSQAGAASLPTYAGAGHRHPSMTSHASRQLTMAGMAPLTILSPVKTSPFRVGTSSRSMSLEIGRSVLERERERGGDKTRPANTTSGDDAASMDGSVSSSMSALTASTIAGGPGSVSALSQASASTRGGGGRVGVVRVKSGASSLLDKFADVQ